MDGLYLLEQGQVIAQQTHDGASVDLTTFNPGDYFGEMALLSGAPRSFRTTVTSDEGANLFFVPKEHFERFLAANLNVMRQFINLMSRRLAEISGAEILKRT